MYGSAHKIHLCLISETTNMGWQGCTASFRSTSQKTLHCSPQEVLHRDVALLLPEPLGGFLYKDYHRIVLIDQALSWLWMCLNNDVSVTLVNKHRPVSVHFYLGWLRVFYWEITAGHEAQQVVGWQVTPGCESNSVCEHRWCRLNTMMRSVDSRQHISM